MDKFLWHKRAHDSIASGYLTATHTPLIVGIYPTHIVESHGCFFSDTNGKTYTDYMCGHGTNIIGYGNQNVARAVYQSIQSGVCPSFATVDEVLTAERLKECFPFVDCFRFFKTETEARFAAMSIAKNNFEMIRPVMFDTGKDNIERIKTTRERCDQKKLSLIFDETQSGFRYKNLGACNTHGVLPDLLILGGAMANGFPLAAVGGKRALMESAPMIGAESSGDTASLAACRATISQLTTKSDLRDLWSEGERFLKSFNEIASGVVEIIGYPTHGRFSGSKMNLVLFFQECCKAGIVFGPHWYFNFDLIRETEKTLNTVLDVCIKIKTGSARLEGEISQTLFGE